MTEYPKEVQQVIDELKKFAWMTTMTINVDEPAGEGDTWFIDVSHAGNRVCIQASLDYSLLFDETLGFGFSLIDDDTGMENAPDCICNHIPTLAKYVSILLSLE